MLWRDFDSDGQMELALYYKGRAESGTPGTMMGLAIAESPEGPFKVGLPDDDWQIRDFKVFPVYATRKAAFTANMTTM